MLVVALIWVVLAFMSPYFLTTSNVLNILLQSSNLALLTIGETFVIITAEIDLSLGSMEALAGALAAVLIVKIHMPVTLAVAMGLVAGLVSGVISGVATTRVRIPSFISTLAMLSIASGAALIMTGGTSVYGLPAAFQFMGQGFIGPIPVPVLIALVIAAACHFVLKYTRFGLDVYAVGGGAEAARLAGVNVERVKIAVLALSGVLAASGGLILTSRLNSGQGTIGSADLLMAIAAVVIGGTSLMGGIGSITGSLIGVLLIGTITDGLDLLAVSAFWQQVAIGAIILAAVLIDQLGKRATGGSR
ncbi:MAG TPA: ABC transporter permease [bacterium]|nr:ABC transporter permease [bacterium]